MKLILATILLAAGVACGELVEIGTPPVPFPYPEVPHTNSATPPKPYGLKDGEYVTFKHEEPATNDCKIEIINTDVRYVSELSVVTNLDYSIDQKKVKDGWFKMEPFYITDDLVRWPTPDYNYGTEEHYIIQTQEVKAVWAGTNMLMCTTNLFPPFKTLVRKIDIKYQPVTNITEQINDVPKWVNLTMTNAIWATTGNVFSSSICISSNVMIGGKSLEDTIKETMKKQTMLYRLKSVFKLGDK